MNKNSSLIDNSNEMEGIEETECHTSLYNNNKQHTSFYSMETVLDLFEVYLELRSSQHTESL